MVNTSTSKKFMRDSRVRTAKYTIEITYPDDEVMDEDNLQKALLYSPKLEDCLIWVYTDETKTKLRSVEEILKKKDIPLKELDNMISVREKQQDYVSQEDSVKIEKDIEKIMEYIDAHYNWCPNCSSYFEDYKGFKKSVKLHGEFLCTACIKVMKQNIKR